MRYSPSTICKMSGVLTNVKGSRVWVMARPSTAADTFLHRAIDAWGVLTGKLDALKWEGDQ